MTFQLRHPLRAVIGAVLTTVLAVTSVAVLTPAASADPLAIQAQSPDRQLRVVTYNIHHAQGADGVLDLERVATVLADSGAEVIGLQEVDKFWGDRSDNVDQATWLGRRLGMHVVYGANLDLDPATADGQRRQYGTAILSRYPIQSWSNTLLPKLPAGEQRGLLQANINVRGVKLRFLNTHLQHNNSAERLAQIDAILAASSTSARSTILVGDMNARPDSVEYGKLVGEYADSWPTVGVGPGYTFDSDNPQGRIDYVLTRAGVQPVGAEVIATLASDHMPVLVDLLLTGGVGNRQ